MTRVPPHRAPAAGAARAVQAFVVAATVVAALAGGDAFADTELRFEHDARTRSALVHIPATLAADTRPVPLVLNFHGGGGHAANQRAYSRMDRLADREGFIVAYPNGTGPLPDRLLTWNAGRCCGQAASRNVDDVGFVRALIDRLADRWPIDRSRVYATGLSNGAMMSYRLAIELPDRIAAIAPVAGSMVAAGPGGRAMPILHIHSVDDRRALFAGGLGPPFPFTDVRVEHPDALEVLQRWAAFEACALPAVETAQRRGAAGSVGEGHSATRLEFQGCRDGAEVVLWRLTGAGHVWPGGQPDFLPRLLGPGTDVIDANEEMWRFFSRFSLPRTRE